MKQYRTNKFINFKYTKGKTDIYSKMFHDYYEIYLLLGGDVEFINNHIKQTLSPFQLVLIPPGEYHQFVVKGNFDNYERCVIDIYPGFIEPEILENSFFGKELISLSGSDRIVEHFIYLINCLSNTDESDFSHILPAVVTDMLFLLKNGTVGQKIFHGNFNRLSVDVINYIDAHFTEQIDLNMLSHRYFCSVSSLCHIFKKDFGISIKKYILQKRINAAKIAIQQGEKPKVVSTRYGFLDYSTFYRDYKKYLGISPSKTYTLKTLTNKL